MDVQSFLKDQTSSVALCPRPARFVANEIQHATFVIGKRQVISCSKSNSEQTDPRENFTHHLHGQVQGVQTPEKFRVHAHIFAKSFCETHVIQSPKPLFGRIQNAENAR